MLKENKQNIDYKIVDEVNLDINKISRNSSSCFVTKPANQWIEEAKSRPIPNMLFGELWYEGEVCILYADTNTGKSILGVQIADSISKGRSIYNFKLEVQPQKVVYLDFELSDKQFEKRYSNHYRDHYIFSENFHRAEINTELELPKNFKTVEEYLIYSISPIIEIEKPKVLIIDNITYLGTDNEKAKDALMLMKELKAIGKKCNVSILVLAHTPKIDLSKPITKNDLAGSKMLMNFCDSAFAIGISKEGTSIRYLKQIKQRNTECVYHANNIALFEIKLDYNFLKFDFIGFDEEANHLIQSITKDKNLRNLEIIELHQQGLSNVEIADRLGISEGTVRYQLKKQD